MVCTIRNLSVINCDVTILIHVLYSVDMLYQGNRLDSLARKFLWDVGLDYMHGTGHGIGMYLNVHEGPMGISWKVYPDDPGLQEGMFLSNGKKHS